MLDAEECADNLLERITENPLRLAGKPTIRGMRIPVSLVLNLLAYDYSFARIVEAYPVLEEDDIRAALLFASVRMDRWQEPMADPNDPFGDVGEDP